MWKSPALNLRRLSVGKEGAVVRLQRRPQAGELTVLDRELAVHVVVAREAGGHQVSRPVLDPLHRAPDQQRRGRRDHVARVDRHLVAEAAADVRRDDPDVLLGEPRDEREQRAMRVRRLRRHVDRRLARRRVHVGDTAAALERRRVAARVVGVERDDVVGLCEGAVGRLLVARLPVVDVVRLLPFLVVPDERRALGQRLIGVVTAGSGS